MKKQGFENWIGYRTRQAIGSEVQRFSDSTGSTGLTGYICVCVCVCVCYKINKNK